MKKVFTVLFLILFSLFFAGSASAAMLDFGVIWPTETGSIYYNASSGGALKGENIQVDNVSGIGTTPDTLVPITNGVFSFTTGTLSEFNDYAATKGYKEYVFGAGGEISLTGSVDFPSGNLDITNGILFSGSFQSATVFDYGGQIKVVSAKFWDTKHENLLEYYNLPDGTYSGTFSLLFAATADPTTHYFTSSYVMSGDIGNEPVPVPASLLLLGSGLVGLVGLGRKKVFKG